MLTWEAMKRAGQTAFIDQGNGLHDEHMFNTLFSFVDPIVDPMEGDWLHFLIKVEALFDSPEQFITAYERGSIARLTPAKKDRRTWIYILDYPSLGNAGGSKCTNGYK